MLCRSLYTVIMEAGSFLALKLIFMSPLCYLKMANLCNLPELKHQSLKKKKKRNGSF